MPIPAFSMLDISLTIEGDKIIIEGLNKLSQELMPAVRRGLQRSAISIHRQAFQWLSGAGAKGKSTEVTSAAGKTYLRWDKQSIAAGGYPVPVRTGWLRRCLNWLKPGASKTGEAGTFTAGPNEVVIYDSARYANVIHEGTESSKKFGPRQFLTDAFELFNRGLGIKGDVQDEIQKAKAAAGLA